MLEREGAGCLVALQRLCDRCSVADEPIISLHQGDLNAAESALGEDARSLLDWFSFLHGEGPLPEQISRSAWAGHEENAAAHAELATMCRVAIEPQEGLGSEDWRTAGIALRAFLRDKKVLAPASLSSTDAALRVEQMALRALAALTEGDMAGATSHARQVTRAAYSESLRTQEYLAYWVLARVRRAGGNAYAAARIAGALTRAAPPSWWPLFDWELILSGGDPGAVGRALTEPADTWLRLCRAAELGDMKGRAEHEKALRAMEMPERFARERDVLCRGLDEIDAALVPLSTSVAGALHESADRLGWTPAVWRVRPGSKPKRQWCVAQRQPDEVPVGFDAGDRPRSALAAFAEAADAGIEEGQLFAKVYGFAYETEQHDGLLRVLLHRMRASIESVATIERDQNRLVLVPRAAFVCPEPESEPPFGDRLLRLIASRPGRTAAELAEEAGANLRSVQRALRLLGDSGACVSEKIGRKLVYAVEDTTFSEPTHFRKADA